MKRMMKKLAIALLLMLPMTAAFGQSQTVRQSGQVTQKHIAAWTSNGVVQDGGSAAIPFISSIGTVGQGPTMCANSAVTTGAYNQLCLSANTSSNAQIILQNYGGAPAVALDFVVNGVVQTFTGSTGGVAGDMACFLTIGSVTTCGLAAASGIITSGTWHGSAVALLYGGTGATTASGARTNLGLGSMATQDASAVAVTGGSITGMPSPSLSSDVATKSYVDATASGLNILAQSTLATATVLPNSPTYSNGTAGVGATLTAGSNTTLTVDGTAAPLNTVVLVKNQAAATQNGIYTVTAAGDGSNPWVLTRAVYFDQAAEMKAGSYTFVTSGAANINTSWTLQTAVTTVGSDSLTFVQFSSATTGTVTEAIIAAGTGISASGTCTITTIGTCTVTNAGVTAIAGNTGMFTLTYPISNSTNAVVYAGPTTSGYLSVTSTTVLTFAPKIGDTIKINGAVQQIPSAGVTCSNSGSASTLYRVYVFMSGATMTCELSATAHATSTTGGNVGTEIKSGDNTRSLVGMTYMDASNHFIDIRTVSWFNRQNKSFRQQEVIPSNNVTTAIPFVTWDESFTISGFGSAHNSTVDAENALTLRIDGVSVGAIGGASAPATGSVPLSASLPITSTEGNHTFDATYTINAGIGTFEVQTWVMTRG